MRLAYVDSCIWITLIEGLESYRPPIQNALARLAQEGWELCTSDAARTLPVRPAVFKDALVTATREGLKAMDSVHVAIAAQHGCERFVTTDPHFQDLTSPSPHLIALPAA